MSLAIQDKRGLAAVRALRQIHKYQGNIFDAAEYCPSDDAQVKTYLRKAANASGTESVLIARNDLVVRELAEYILEQTAIAKIVAASQNYGFYSPVANISGGGASWRGEGRGIKLIDTKAGLNSLPALGVSAITVVTNELANFAQPTAAAADLAIRNHITSEAVKAIDGLFCSNKDAVDGISPAGLFKNVIKLPPKDTAYTLDSALSAMLNKGAMLRGLVVLMPADQILKLPMQTFTALQIAGIQLVTSESLKQCAVVDTSRIQIALAGADLFISRQASIEMDDEPVSHSVGIETTPATDSTPAIIADAKGAQAVSLFHTNSVAYRVDLLANWHALSDAVCMFEMPTASA